MWQLSEVEKFVEITIIIIIIKQRRLSSYKIDPPFGIKPNGYKITEQGELNGKSGKGDEDSIRRKVGREEERTKVWREFIIKEDRMEESTSHSSP